MPDRKRGFTLIELLVVIAIIAILAAILFPVFARAKKRAQYATCTSNLKQIGTAIALYRDDNYDGLPLYLMDPGRSWPFGRRQYLERYMKSTKAFICPADYTKGAGDQGWQGATNFKRSDGQKTTSYMCWISPFFRGITAGWPSDTPPPTHDQVDWVQWMIGRVHSKFITVSCNWHDLEGQSYMSVPGNEANVSTPTLRLDGSVQLVHWGKVAGWSQIEKEIYGIR